MFLSHRSYGMLEEIQRTVEAGRAQPRHRLRRHLAYYATARRFVLGDPLPSVRVEVDGQVVAEDAAVVTVANVETYRGFLSLTPAASPVDGLFDVCAIPRASKPVFWLRLLKLLLGSAGRWDGLVRCRGRRARAIVPGARPRTWPCAAARSAAGPPGSIERLEARQAAAERVEARDARVIERRGAA